MHIFEQRMFRKAKKLIRSKLKNFREFETFIIDHNFNDAIRVIEDFDENLNDLVSFSIRDRSAELQQMISFETKTIQLAKEEALEILESKIEIYRGSDNKEKALSDLVKLIDESKVIVQLYYDNFVNTINRLLQNFKIISNIVDTQNRMRVVHRSFQNLLNNLENYQFVITVDNASSILIENCEKLQFSLEEHFQDLISIAEKIVNMSRNPCNETSKLPGCPESDDSSSDEDDFVSLVSEKSEKLDDKKTDGKAAEKKSSECFQEPTAEHTRVESIEKLKTNADHLHEQIANIEEEIERVNQTIDEKKSGILKAILELVQLEEIIEDIEISIADELYQFQMNVRAIEAQLLENFKGRNDSEIKERLENDLEKLKMIHNRTVKCESKHYSDIAKQAKNFAATIGDVVEEYKQLEDKNNEKFAYNIEKLNSLISRPAEFCKDSNNERFFFNKEKIKIFQADSHRSQYILNSEGEKVKIKEGKKLETDVNGEFYLDIKDRKIYTKYFFEDEHGRYYIDINGFRHYQTDPRASEYALINGNWTKIKDGSYEVDEKGLRIPDEKEDEAETIELVENLVMGKPNSKPSKISDEEFKYLQEILRPVIVKACAACYINQPAKPVQYFAEFIRNYQQNQKMFEQSEKELKKYLEFRTQME